MSDPKRVLENTLRSKAMLDAARNVKKYHELIQSGMDPMTAFLQVFWGIYYVIPPGEPRPDYVGTLVELHAALKDANAFYAQMKDETEAHIGFLETIMKNPETK